MENVFYSHQSSGNGWTIFDQRSVSASLVTNRRKTERTPSPRPTSKRSEDPQGSWNFGTLNSGTSCVNEENVETPFRRQDTSFFFGSTVLAGGGGSQVIRYNSLDTGRDTDIDTFSDKALVPFYDPNPTPDPWVLPLTLFPSLGPYYWTFSRLSLHEVKKSYGNLVSPHLTSHLYFHNLTTPTPT